MPERALTLQMLDWIAVRPRAYGETMEAWRSTCPRLTIWEDALAAGLVAVEGGGPMKDAPVRLTEAGRTLLHAAAPPRPDPETSRRNPSPEGEGGREAAG